MRATSNIWTLFTSGRLAPSFLEISGGFAWQRGLIDASLWRQCGRGVANEATRTTERASTVTMLADGASSVTSTDVTDGVSLGVVEELTEGLTAPVPSASQLPERCSRTRLRSFLVLSDTAVALAVGLWTVPFSLNLESAIVAAWWLTMTLRVDRKRRIAELLDTRPMRTTYVVWVAAATVIGTFALESTSRTRTAVITISLLFGAAILTRMLVKARRVQQALGLRLRESVLLVGERGHVARTLREWVRVDDIEVVGVCVPDSDDGSRVVEGHPVLGSPRDIVAISETHRVDAVALHDVEDLGGRQLARLQWALERTKTFVSLITPVANTALQRVRTRSVGRRLIVDVSTATPSGVVVFIRAIFDRVLALFLLVLTMPVLIAAIIAIRITSPGPAIFRQVRVRDNNRTFIMYKLRTMTVRAERMRGSLEKENEVGGGLFKMRRDPRVTRVGGLLRRLSIDEIPQLVNIVRGDMALVGPRPALPSEVATYDEMASRRLAVKPGLTGLWQVSGRSRLSWEESVRLDMDYVDNRSPGLDTKIAMDTVRAVIKRDGAY